MVYILIAILMFGVLIAVHEFGHFITAKALGVQVNEFAIGMGPLIFSREKGETRYSLRALPIGGYCAMEGEDDDESASPRAFGRAAWWKKLTILAAGSFMNFLTGLLLCVILMEGATHFITPVIAGLAPDFPQELVGQQGLMPGDRIVSIDGERVYLHSDVRLLFSRSNGETMDLVVRRAGEQVVLRDYPLYPRTLAGADGAPTLRYGLDFSVEEATLDSKLLNSWYTAIDFVRMVRLSLMDLITGAAGLRDLAGPVGIVSTMTQVGSQSETPEVAAIFMVEISALIAVNLAVMNLLPLPALDGGRIFFLLLNGIVYGLSRRRIPARYEGYVHMTGMLLLLGLMLVVTFSDIGRILGY